MPGILEGPVASSHSSSMAKFITTVPPMDTLQNGALQRTTSKRTGNGDSVTIRNCSVLFLTRTFSLWFVQPSY